MTSVFRTASSFFLTSLSNRNPNDFHAVHFPVSLVGLSLVFVTFFFPGLRFGVETEVAKVRSVLGRTASVTSSSRLLAIGVTNFELISFSTLAIKLKSSLVFLIFVAQGLQTRSDREELKKCRRY